MSKLLSTLALFALLVLATPDAVKADQLEQMQALLPAAKSGDADAQFKLGNWYANTNYPMAVSYQEKQALFWYHKSANQGLAIAQNNLALMLQRGGISFKKNLKEASLWYQKAADGGNATAQLNLGQMLINGESMPKSASKAVFWFRKAAEQGNVEAQLTLGILYYEGMGVTKNYSESYSWYKKAAEAGNINAQSLLGELYENGQGIEQNYKTAADWYGKASSNGDTEAKLALGRLYESGNGVPRNGVIAYAIYLSMSPEIVPNTGGKIKSLEESLTSEQKLSAYSLRDSLSLPNNFLSALAEAQSKPN